MSSSPFNEPRPEPRLEFAFAAHTTLTPPHIVRSHQIGRERAGVFVTHGRFEGPRVRGEVVGASGGDYAALRPDGVLDFDARYMLRTDDGVLIYLESRGYRWSAPEVAERLKRGEPVDPSQVYMRVSTRFEVEAGPYDWLARNVFIGIGERLQQGNLTRYYQLL
ncbi:DUF3237 domain-containing protein [Aquabacterium sp. J223]|uniref:DUF3237 domain-containing protein n=1 Tax=Aquabacterium sp. J223 TaxID=2898431 RepID=UPI0021AE0E20|nr:DUF3237 domain-containing protein [Aquabacterium sp. J223]UUX96407.1 DUF3237 domain-containing protein [Aquabacterium sp. J223]